MTSSDNNLVQEEELTVLSSAYSEEFRFNGPNSYQITIQLNNPSTNLSEKDQNTITLEWSYPDDYPSQVPPAFSLRADWLSESDKEVLSRKLKTMYSKEGGSVILYSWIQWLKDNAMEVIDLPEVNKTITPNEGKPVQRIQKDSKAKEEDQTRKKGKKGHKKNKKEEEEVKKGMRTSEDVFNRIKWDPELNVDDFVIGYTDRFVGIKEAAFLEWEHHDLTDEVYIPWHRVQYFKKKGQIVWDRRTREDYIFGTEKEPEEPLRKTKTMHTEVKAPKTKTSEKKEAKNKLANKEVATTGEPKKKEKKLEQKTRGTEHQKTVQSAVVIIPPESVWKSIQAIRMLHDKSYLRWMPHINMLYPFVPQQKFDEAVIGVQKAVAAAKSFKVTLQDIETFIHKGSCTIWIDPETGNGEIEELQKELEKAFPFCNDLSSKSDHGFKPHLSVATCNVERLESLSANIQKDWKPIEFTVSEVFLISRTEDEPFSVLYRIPFGDKPDKLKRIYAPELPPTNSKQSEELKQNIKPSRKGGPHITPLCLFGFDFQSNRWSMTDAADVNVHQLKIVTFNVLFDYHVQEKIFSKRRVDLTCNLLEQCGADIICLQEVTRPFLQKLLTLKWVREKYNISDADGKTLENYGNLLLTKLPVSKIYLFQDGSKPCLFAEFLLNGELFLMPTVHLTSDKAVNFQNKRAKQLNGIFSQTKNAANTLLIGDFNFGDGPEQDSIDWGEFKDAWRELFPLNPGYTFDPVINTMALATTETGKQRRLDRIFLKSKRWKVQSIKMIGTEHTKIFLNQDEKEFSKIEEVEVIIFPSDHFGLFCEIVFM